MSHELKIFSRINAFCHRAFVGILVVWLAFAEAEAASQVTGARLWAGDGKQQFIFDVSAHMKIHSFSLLKPSRLVLDLSNTEFRRPLPKLDLSATNVKKVRTGSPKKSVARIVFDLDAPLTWKVTPLAAKGPYGKRIMVELFGDKTKLQSTKMIRPRPSTQPLKYSANGQRSILSASSGRDVIVAIDAGHGGKDPGALGHEGAKEKDLVLAIARETYAAMKKVKGLKPVLVRDGDYFIRLKNRRDIARNKHQADVFISIHADAFDNKRARGASVFTLSKNGATSATARYLANKENNSDFIGGYKIENGSDSLSETILTVAMDGVLAESDRVGQNVLNEIGSVSHLHKRHVERAGFLVLKNPDMLSILIETGFISNPAEEKKLRNKSHQRKIAKAIINGTSRYFRDHPIPGTYFAKVREKQRLESNHAKHVVGRGDTLIGIANRYRVSMASLKRVNEIQSNRLSIGKILLIPKV